MISVHWPWGPGRWKGQVPTGQPGLLGLERGLLVYGSHGTDPVRGQRLGTSDGLGAH